MSITITYHPADLASVLRRLKIDWSVLADRLRKTHRIKVTRQTLRNWSEGRTDPGLDQWIRVDRALAKELAQ